VVVGQTAVFLVYLQQNKKRRGPRVKNVTLRLYVAWVKATTKDTFFFSGFSGAQRRHLTSTHEMLLCSFVPCSFWTHRRMAYHLQQWMLRFTWQTLKIHRQRGYVGHE
jgi:hypothetical protein